MLSFRVFLLALATSCPMLAAKGQTVDNPLYMGKAKTGEDVWYYGARAQCGDLPRTDECWLNPMIKYRLDDETFNTVLDCKRNRFQQARSLRSDQVYFDVVPSSPATAKMVQMACQAARNGVDSNAQLGNRILCEWVSEVTPDAVIRFTSTTGTGYYYGSLIYRNQHIINFEQGQSQGYGGSYWNTGTNGRRSGELIVFRGSQLKRGTPGGLPQGPQRLLIVGLGSSLWYGDNPQWRDADLLIKAAEGFWRPSPACSNL
jgi:hypothetical protein